MADFLGNSAGIEGALSDWGNYWGQVDQRARLRYDHREARDEREREHQYQLERGRSNQDAYAGRAGLLAPVDGQFSAMGPRNVPSAPGGTMPVGVQPPGGTGAQVSTDTTAAVPQSGAMRNLSLTSAEMQSLFTHRGGARLGFRQYSTQEIASNPQLRDILQRGQQYGQLQIDEVQGENGEITYRVQQRTQGSVSEQNFSVPEANTFLGMPLTGQDARRMRGEPIVPWGNPEYGRDRRENAEDINRRSRMTGVTLPGQEAGALPEVDPQADVVGGNVGLAPQDPSDPSLRTLDPDTSGALAATPEMQMLQTVVQDRQRLARLAAAHGRNTEAEQMYAEALQGQAAYLQQSRLVMLRAASQGHRTALADLLGLYSGRPEGTTRLQPVGNTNQYNLQVLDGNGRWTSTPAGPFTIEQLFQTARGLVDREAVMAESEANSEYVRARIAADADIRVASIRALTDQQRMMVDAAIAEMEAGSRERIAQGNAELVVDSANNRSYLQWWERGPDGRPIQRMREIREQNVRVADSNGIRTERQVVGRNVTGINNVTAGGN